MTDKGSDLFDCQWIIERTERFFDRCVAPKVRPISQFAAEEIVVPRGNFQGTRYNPFRKPASMLWFAEIESGRWLKHVYTGPSQAGKTLDAFLIPLLWCIFEKEEDTIIGLPDSRLANRKWKKDIVPIIQKSRYADLLPSTGPGSRGGDVYEIQFLNGVNLTFMSFGGGDKSRASETAKNLIITETDGGDESGEASDEGTKIDQLIARTMSFDLDAFIVMECTVSTDVGITWQEIKNGTDSKIVRPCPHCKNGVTPERQHFTGWELSNSKLQAGRDASWKCPKCAKPWTEQQRADANQKSVLVHSGQTVKFTKSGKAKISGPIPDTDTLGFRMSAVDNIFRTSEMLGRLEWDAARQKKKDEAETAIKQFQYAEPVLVSDDDELPQIDPYEACDRIGRTKQNIIPPSHEILTVGTDLRATQLHYTVKAWMPDATNRVIDYGIAKVFSRRLGVERGIRRALEWLRDKLREGYMNTDGEIQFIDQWWIDSGWKSKEVYKFVNHIWQDEHWNERVYPYRGQGAGKQYKEAYRSPNRRNKSVKLIGEEFYIKSHQYDGMQVFLAFVNADHYKSFVHNRYRIPMLDEDKQSETFGEYMPGAASFFIPSDGGADHLEYLRHLCAETEHKEFIDGKGEVSLWRAHSRVNHFFDADYAASAAAVFCGVEAAEIGTAVYVPSAAAPAQQVDHKSASFDDYGSLGSQSGLTMPDGRPFEY